MPKCNTDYPHSYSKEIQYFYKCGKCGKTWNSCNFFDLATCPHCHNKATVLSKYEYEKQKICSCKKT